MGCRCRRSFGWTVWPQVFPGEYWVDLSAPSWVFAWEPPTTLAGASMCLGMFNIRFFGLPRVLPSQTLIVSWAFFKTWFGPLKEIKGHRFFFSVSTADLPLRWRDQMLLLKAIWQNLLSPLLTGYIFGDIINGGEALLVGVFRLYEIPLDIGWAEVRLWLSAAWHHWFQEVKAAWMIGAETPMKEKTNQGVLAIGRRLSWKVENDLIHMSWW